MGRCSTNCVNLQDFSKKESKPTIAVMGLNQWNETTVDEGGK